MMDAKCLRGSAYRLLKAMVLHMPLESCDCSMFAKSLPKSAFKISVPRRSSSKLALARGAAPVTLSPRLLAVLMTDRGVAPPGALPPSAGWRGPRGVRRLTW
eukprot:CAMPEP_0176085850 /NCGR_PEP_ID=MMETSP0120_2-20121206/42972_1 /TAXON_ID=160619 /ORGANISM="Kryptoperidinium foliaceum, Strain CCMP 1326" /LENGTH=101 /DNA_ID=CAMNT_0017419677 /DNA_START=146 /DNA_END=448 /DNA_ORIENTATION=-